MHEPSSTPEALDPPRDAAGLDEWLRSRLDHRLTIVLLVPPTGHVAGVEAVLTAAIAPQAEMRLRVERIPPPDAASSPTTSATSSAATDSVAARPSSPAVSPAAIERALLKIETLYPDVVLVEHTVDSSADASDAWPRAVLSVADRLGLCDRAFVALIGPAVTRDLARRLGFEDGYPLDTPAPELVRILAREAVARDELRRHGSSPPCYL